LSMDPEVVEAMRRVKDKIQAREEGGLGLPIPDLVSAIIGEEADSELLDLVRSALSQNNQSIEMPEIVTSIYSLYKWRISQT